MTAANAESQQVLREEIIGDAKRQAERILAHARHEAEEFRRKGRETVEKQRRERLGVAQSLAATRRELILASVGVEAGRRRSARIESVLQTIRDEAWDRLRRRDGLDYRAAVAALAAEAVGHMEGQEFILELAEADRQAFGADLAEEVRRRVGRNGLRIAVAAQGAKIDGGVVVRDAGGRQLWDNSLRARLERFWPALRREIATRTALATAGLIEKES